MFLLRAVATLLAAATVQFTFASSSTLQVSEAIRHRLDTEDAVPFGLSRDERETLRRIYSDNAGRPMWTADWRLTEAGWKALAILIRAEDEGLEPSDYGVASLEAQTFAVRGDRNASADASAKVDVALTAGLLRFLNDLRYGRTDVRFGLPGVPLSGRPDVSVRLREAASAGTVEPLVASMAPPVPQYRSLRDTLKRYRQIATQRPKPVSAHGPRTVKPGDSYRDLGLLATWLVATGDLDPGGPLPPKYDEPIVAGVRRFQERHGLSVDGVIGPRTLAALQVAPAARVRQIELAMERLRGLPDPANRPLVAVNIPMFRAWAWNAPLTDARPMLMMNVIVGAAMRAETPVLAAAMRHVVLRPYWDVPPTIVHDEILPLLRQDARYLERQGFEVVLPDGRVSAPPLATDGILEQLAGGEYRLRQRPGPDNALGLVKFVLANDADVHMHGTPAPELFEQPRRDFSHGCIRVDDPISLAEWALSSMPGWTRAKIVEVIAGTQTVRIALSDPPQVVIFYATAVVDPEDDRIYFAEDIYGHDAALNRSLRAVTRDRAITIKERKRVPQ